MHTIQVLLVGFIFIGILIEKTNGDIGDRLWNIFKRMIQSNCNCSPYLCCSKWGYCGSTNAYCGAGCQSGPCKNRPANNETSFIITSEIFQCSFPNINPNIRNRRFQGLSQAMIEMKWKPLNSVEAAIFLAHISGETDGLKNLAEDCIRHGTCNNYRTSWCSIQGNPNRKYYGRGMIYLTYPCHYYEAGKALGLDLLNNPDLVSQSDKVAAATAIWYYKETRMHELAQRGEFGGSSRRLNKYQCSSKNGSAMHMARIKVYHQIRKCFNLSATSTHLMC